MKFIFYYVKWNLWFDNCRINSHQMEKKFSSLIALTKRYDMYWMGLHLTKFRQHLFLNFPRTQKGASRPKLFPKAHDFILQNVLLQRTKCSFEIGVCWGFIKLKVFTNWCIYMRVKEKVWWYMVYTGCSISMTKTNNLLEIHLKSKKLFRDSSL